MGQGDQPKTLISFDHDPDLAFTFRLARDLSMTVGELHSKMSAKEFNEWAFFYLWEQKARDKAYALADAEMKKNRNKR